MLEQQQVDVAAQKLGLALAESVLLESRESAPDDLDFRRHLLQDLNDLLLHSAGPQAQVPQALLNDPGQLELHLSQSAELPAQRLLKSLPQKLGQWLSLSLPQPGSQLRHQWAAAGRRLWELAQVSQS